MASLTTQADAIRSAVASTQSCTPTVSATLKKLLLGKDIESIEPKTTTTKARATKPVTVKPGVAAKRPRAAAQIVQRKDGQDGVLSPKEKAVLATQVINATLKALGDAAKTPSAPRSPAPGKLVQTASRKTLRRSNSVPMTPLQPRSLNRVSTTPGGNTRTCRSPSTTTASTGCLATVECARVAFATLRTLSTAGQVMLPELQLESGSSSFVNKLIALDLFEHALKELRLLKRRLETLSGIKSAKATTSTDAASKTLSELFDYSTANARGPVLGLIITAQLQALRILYGLKKSSCLDSALPFLRASHQSSPLKLLLLSLQDKNSDRSKCARQLDSLAQSLLSLTPSLSTKDDGVAVEPRLSPSPTTALEIQTLAFTIRLHSWGLSGHRGDVNKEVLLPLSRCLGAYARRSSSDAHSNHGVVDAAFAHVWQRIQALDLRPSESSKSPLANIYQTLGTVSRESGNVKEAIKWIGKLKVSTNPKEDSPALCCSVAAQLLALSLKQSRQVDESLVREVLDGLQGSLSGNTTELDDLLVSICQARKASMSIVLGDGELCPVRHLLDSLIFQLPRFALRWLGKPPATAGSTKDFLRFEQRRQLLSKYIQHILDSALMLTKMRLDGGNLAWDLMDSMLLDSLALLENMGDVAVLNAKTSPVASYHVKISHFYYQQHIALRKQTSGPKDTSCLRALRRSIDSVKQRTEAEQVKAQMVMKQERLADLCKTCGRREDAADALRSIRDALVRDEVVADITSASSTQPPAMAWRLNNKTETLSRTVCNLAKLECNPCDWTWLLSGVDKITALEHDLCFIFSGDSVPKQAELSESLVDSLLNHYSSEKYPLRRLRTLLQLLARCMRCHNDANRWMDEAKGLSQDIATDKLGEDSGLARYIPHLQASTACTAALFDSAPGSPAVRQALMTWTSLTTDCQSAEELYKQIDDPSQLLANLQSLADFARMKGFDTLLVSILELSTTVSRLVATSKPEFMMTQNTALCLQHLKIGHSSKAENILEMCREYLSLPELSSDVVASFHLCAAEYHMAVGKFDQAEKHLTEAQISASSESSSNPSRTSRITRKTSIAYAYFLHSMLALERGNSHHALNYAKSAVRILFHDWTRLESLRRPSEGHVDEASQTEVSQFETTEDESSISSSRSAQTETTRAKTSPEFWAMVYPLFRFLLRLSSIYAHIGMYQETMYYADQARKVAESTASITYISQSKTWLATVALTAGKTEIALEVAEDVRSALPSLETTVSTFDMVCQLSRIFRDTHNSTVESALIDLADSMLQTLNMNQKAEVNEPSLESKMEGLTIKEKPRRTRQTKAIRPTRVAAKAAPKKAPSRKAMSPVVVCLPSVEEDIQLSFMRASMLQLRSASLLGKKEWTTAVAALKVACELSRLSADISQERLLMAVAFIGQSLEQLGRDSVFSVLQDSTLSFPSVAAALKDKTDRMSLTKPSPPRKGRAIAQETPGFLDNLRHAQDCLLEAHSIASLSGDGRLLHRIATLLQSVFILISTTSPSKSAVAGHPAHATCSIELARNLIWRRERKALQLESTKPGKADWPIPLDTPDTKRTSLGPSIDMHRFQKDFVDIIPKSWNVVSVSLSDDKHDLCITKLQAGHSPFAIRLPLERASSRDADTEVFSFQQGRAELLDVIQVANRTCHNARDMSAKGAKSAWWAEREALDERMKDLLDNIEQTWLGGFKGIFSQHHRRSDLLARFQKSFQNILDKHLPSRRQVRGRRLKTAPNAKVTLDPRILDLFIGLGDATASSCDLDEPLTDLLYFVVDILQFHGERNAYDEIDFDGMVVETFDALHSYHAAAKSTKDGDDGVHTILVLDKALHILPWESLPCMQGLAISRIPSLACLRRSILEQRSHIQPSEDQDEDELMQDAAREGHHISLNSGTYILNPGADLKNTQHTFGKPLSALPPAWNAIEARAPTETEFETALSQSDLLLYFGHGSGAQYIRGRTIRKLEKCRAVALLMGCSSASLADVGEFECQGPVWNYMLAGSPAVVGTLWDVTDRDIDRFAGRVFEEWGLTPKGTFAEETHGKQTTAGRKGKKKAAIVAEEQADGSQTSLVEAVGRSRGACRLRYLTAAAVCVYGIPVYINK
ncbi:peptidase family C50-domain-containing protein [Pseudomassariella vexata]|uniref:separase n=1 Tax=Pseudomassariella vexata TaxID=1141098 RepID=A0A1Y2EGF6_9PEZI|nr:peptidase family C50-domain-containing protein [Pseudomassariella vexata]ORY69875.1 peptidase family C50-domain-containing protein [Pseudomassariella vexata]